MAKINADKTIQGVIAVTGLLAVIKDIWWYFFPKKEEKKNGDNDK